MYNKLNISEKHLLVLSLFTKGRYKEYYIREAEKILKISLGTARRILNDLEKRGVLESKTRGRIKAYRTRANETSRRYLTLAEQYKAIAFLQNRLIIKEIIEKIMPHINGIGVIFGSYAKGDEKKNSDLDIFVAGECDRKEIKKVSETYGIEVSVKTYPLKTFENNLNKDILLKEVSDNHIIFLNAEQFVKDVFEHG